MEWVEVRAENIEAAEALALDQLGVAREDAEFEVVTREENRLFGLKKTEARVRARVKPADLPSKTTNSNRKRSKNNNKSQKSTHIIMHEIIRQISRQVNFMLFFNLLKYIL